MTGVALGETLNREKERAIILCYLFCYLDRLSAEVQSEVQQERKKSGDLCVRGHRGINFLTKLIPTIKSKSLPKSSKWDLKNIFTRQNSHPFSSPFYHKGQTDSTNTMIRERLNDLGSSRIFICAPLSMININSLGSFKAWELFILLSIQTALKAAQKCSGAAATKQQCIIHSFYFSDLDLFPSVILSLITCYLAILDSYCINKKSKLYSCQDSHPRTIRVLCAPQKNYQPNNICHVIVWNDWPKHMYYIWMRGNQSTFHVKMPSS